MHREGGVQGNLSPRRQKGYCCFSLLRDFRAGPLTHSPCQGGINDPKQLPLGIPTPPTKTYLLRIEYCVFYIRIQIHQHYCYAQNLSNHLFPRALTSQQTYLAISGQMRKPNDMIVLHN